MDEKEKSELRARALVAQGWNEKDSLKIQLARDWLKRNVTPATILHLLDENEALRADLLERQPNPVTMVYRLTDERDKLKDENARLLKRIEALRAALSGLTHPDLCDEPDCAFALAADDAMTETGARPKDSRAHED